jgi:hypothetical protein
MEATTTFSYADAIAAMAHMINYMDYKISGSKTLLLLDYHILDQVFDFEEGDESICISHVTFGMESGTLADESSNRTSQNGALE